MTTKRSEPTSRQQRDGFHLLPVVFVLILIAIGSTIVVDAAGPTTDSTTIVATIEPVRIIVVDQNLTVTQVISNTTDDVRPEVVLGSADGRELPYSPSVQQQYQTLKPSINFASSGTVYQRDSRYLPNVLARFWGFVSRWV